MIDGCKCKRSDGRHTNKVLMETETLTFLKSHRVKYRHETLPKHQMRFDKNRIKQLKLMQALF